MEKQLLEPNAGDDDAGDAGDGVGVDGPARRGRWWDRLT